MFMTCREGEAREEGRGGERMGQKSKGWAGYCRGIVDMDVRMGTDGVVGKNVDSVHAQGGVVMTSVHVLVPRVFVDAVIPVIDSRT